MTNDTDVFDNLQTIMTKALLDMQALVEHEATSKENFLKAVKLFLVGVISNAADIADVTLPGIATTIYADVEAAAKAGGLRAIQQAAKQGGVSYSVSNIAPDDMTTAMNYVGQELSTALFKSIHELPKPLRQREIFLRGIETLLANLLDKKFNAPLNPHDILDSLCEHVHMALDDLEKRNKLH